MKTSELIEILCSASEEEVYVEIDDVLYEISIGHQDEAFDGFDTVYPACITLKPKNDENN